MLSAALINGAPDSFTPRKEASLPTTQFINGTDAGIQCNWFRALDIGYLYKRDNDGSLVPILDYRAYRTVERGRVQFVGRGLIEYGSMDSFPGPGHGLASPLLGNGFIESIGVPDGTILQMYSQDKSSIIVSLQRIDNTSPSGSGNTVQLFISQGDSSTGTPTFSSGNFPFLLGLSPGYSPPPLNFTNYQAGSTTPLVNIDAGSSYEFQSNSMFLIAPGSSGGKSVFGGETLGLRFTGTNSIRISGRAYRVPGPSSL